MTPNLKKTIVTECSELIIILAIFMSRPMISWRRWAMVFAPLGGLPSRLHQIRKSLSLFVCLSARIFADFYRMVSAPASNAEFYRVFETGSEKRSVSSSNSSGNEPNRGTRFFSSLFHKMSKRNMPGLKPS